MRSKSVFQREDLDIHSCASSAEPGSLHFHHSISHLVQLNLLLYNDIIERASNQQARRHISYLIPKNFFESAFG
jgi:hypothetical protein